MQYIALKLQSNRLCVYEDKCRTYVDGIYEYMKSLLPQGYYYYARGFNGETKGSHHLGKANASFLENISISGWFKIGIGAQEKVPPIKTRVKGEGLLRRSFRQCVASPTPIPFSDNRKEIKKGRGYRMTEGRRRLWSEEAEFGDDLFGAAARCASRVRRRPVCASPPASQSLRHRAQLVRMSSDSGDGSGVLMLEWRSPGEEGVDLLESTAGSCKEVGSGRFPT
ncbi:hypothetical protein GW17_00033756 [Ensete ventricosum]|nr:hypothetical protein GW17_00033756 [Ensete ventricosum]